MINMYFEFGLDNHHLKTNLCCYAETRYKLIFAISDV